jgi:predicted thioesterase
MLALALHWVAKHYMKEYLDANALTTGKEFLFRMLYPSAVLFIVWNMRVFNK